MPPLTARLRRQGRNQPHPGQPLPHLPQLEVLGLHLANVVRTGTSCSYPERLHGSSDPSAWHRWASTGYRSVLTAA
jgi:hypothetical protein